MMELATRSIEEIEVRLARVESERASLLALRAAWERYLTLDEPPSDQPEQGKGPVDEAPAGVDHPAPVPPGYADCPECGERVRAQGLGSHQRKHKPGYRTATRRSRAKQPTAMVGEGAPVAPGGEAEPARAPASPIESIDGGDDAAPVETEAAASPPGGAPPPITHPQVASSPTARSGAPSVAGSLEPPVWSQPGSARSGRAPGPVGTPTPASHPCTWPGCDREYDTKQRAGAHRFQAHIRERPPSVKARAPKPAAKPNGDVTPRPFERRTQRDGKAQCPTCLDWFVSDERLEEHRTKRHRYERGKATESYLCSRCPEAFATLAERMEHEAKHPPAPLSREPVGSNPTTRRGRPTGVPIA